MFDTEGIKIQEISLASERSERAQSCLCSIEISDTYIYIYIYVCGCKSSYVCTCLVVRTVGGV